MTTNKPDISVLETFLETQTNSNNQTQTQKLENAIAQFEEDMQSQHYDLEDTVLKLSDYLKTVEIVIKETFNHQVWVKAEIRNLSSKGGHYYFELAEKDDEGKIVASCRGNLWRYKAERVLNKFARATGMELTRDLTVMLKVTASMHPQYGFALTITDIDPNYTLGDLARQYNAMLDRLIGEGLTQSNKDVAVPLDIANVIVISPEKAAGLGDFRAEADILDKNNACHFHYHHATFQGNHAPREIRHAITQGVNQFEKKHDKLPDILVIIRGGGAVGDLAYLNDYELAALIAEQPIPVWVGIGHERDRVILDEVAHTSFDTPSKVINAVINHLKNMVETTLNYHQTIKTISSNSLQDMQNRCEQEIYRIQNNASKQINLRHNQSQSYMLDIERASTQILQQASLNTEQRIQSIKHESLRSIDMATRQSHQYKDTLQISAKNWIKVAQSQTDHLREIILLQHPRRILEQGYALIKSNQVDYTRSTVISSATNLTTNREVTIELKDGEVEAIIK